jgi:hypothetical protein
VETPLNVARPAQRTALLLMIASLSVLWLVGLGSSVYIGSWQRGGLCLLMLGLQAVFFGLSARHFALYADRLEVVTQRSVWVVPYAQIEEVRAFKWRKDSRSLVAPYGGWPFKTTMIVTGAQKPGLVGVLYRGRGLIVSAIHQDAFIAALEDARTKYASSKASTT